MNSLDWDNLRYFLAAARTLSLSAASRALDSNQPTVGRRIDALETQLGVRLFQRHSAGLTLTAEGRRLLAAAGVMEEGAAGVFRAVSSDSDGMAGTVRISAPEGLGIGVFAARLPELYARYPLLDIMLEVSAARADLKRGGADVALRLLRPEDGDVVSRRVCDMGFGMYASEDYLARSGMPEAVDALRHHAFITYGDELRGQAENVWLEEMIAPGRAVFRSDSTMARLAALCGGAGIAVMPHLLMARRSTCVRVLPQYQAPARTLWIAVHGDLRHVPRVRAVMDFIEALFREHSRAAEG